MVATGPKNRRPFISGAWGRGGCRDDVEVGKPLAASDMVAVDPEPPRPDLVTPWPDLVSLPRSGQGQAADAEGGGRRRLHRGCTQRATPAVGGGGRLLRE